MMIAVVGAGYVGGSEAVVPARYHEVVAVDIEAAAEAANPSASIVIESTVQVGFTTACANSTRIEDAISATAISNQCQLNGPDGCNM